jgi:phospholipid/cholesterol/gamma-HCH transport system substrate-binding protein
VGAFVLAALLVFATLVYLLGRQAGLFERQYRLVARFGQVGGLTEGATVRLVGVPVGRVTAIRLPEPGAAKVQVELTVVRRVQSRIRADSVARIETLGLLGDKIVEVSLGSSEAAILPAGATVPTEEPFDTRRLTKQGTELLGNLLEVSGGLRRVIAELADSSTGSDLAETVRAVRAVAVELERGQGVLHRLVYDRALGAAVADAAQTIRQMGETVQKLDRILADPQTSGLAGDAAAAVRDAREAAQRANRVLRQVEEGGGLLHALIYDESRTLRDLDGLLGRAEALVAGVERGEGALGVLLRDPATAGALRRLTGAAAGLAEAIDRGRASDSLLRALLDDPALAADLRETVRSFRDVTARVARGEGLLGQLTQPGSESAVNQAAQGLAGMGRLADALAGDARLEETLGDLRAAMANLRAITARIEAGEGTLGGLAVDPTVYENLAAFLEGAQRSLLLRALIRSTIGSGRPDTGRP